MSAKTQNNNTFENISANVANVAQNAGLIMMVAATTLGLVETSERQVTRAALSLSPVYAVAGNSEEVNANRRERTEESGPHFVSYSVAQRTPGRTGKQ